MDLPIQHLNELYKDPRVNQVSSFGRIAAGISPADIVESYARARELAPRRHLHGKDYFVEHSGSNARSATSNRKEEHLAIALMGALHSGNSTTLPAGESLEIIDYQMPLKARRSDAGVGKVDLVGLVDRDRFAIVELKVRPNSNRPGDTPLRAFLEALAYCAIVEANATDIAGELKNSFNRQIKIAAPILLVMAPQDYWTGYLGHSAAGEWWPMLRKLAADIAELLGIRSQFVALRNIELRMGTSETPPRLSSDISLLEVAELAHQ
ncbi:MAG: hypothetical protein AMS22_13970 [Thiotrichales bacterium SG8_50]|nr:MAG: hypothetical protein AMS22_13970 [Thiotrichales bacterium SG8_50]